MPEPRKGEGGALTVTVGLSDGTKKYGHLPYFAPDAELLTVNIPSQSFDGSVRPTTISVPMKKVAYVAFHPVGEGRDVGPPKGELTEFDVHMPGGVCFSIKADPVDTLDALGYYAYPVGRSSHFSEIFFFAHAINGREDKAPLGEMLIEQELLTLEELEQGLEHQAAAQNVPIGQILVEQNKIAPKELDRAVENQRAQARRGRPLRLGEVLVEAGLATDGDITAALKEQKKRRGKRLGEVLVDMGIVSEVDVARTLAQKFNLPFVDLDHEAVNQEAFLQIPLGLIKKYQVFPFHMDALNLKVAMCDPLAMEALDMLRFSISKQIIEVMVTPSQLAARLEPYLVSESEEESTGLTMDDILKELTLERGEPDEDEDEGDQAAIEEADEGAVAKLVNRIILDAVERGVSDIHIEPNGGEFPVIVRFRVDGACYIYRKLPAMIRSNLTARIKIMSNLDIAEKRKPQDGKIRFRISDQQVELRVATLPTVTKDEDVVLRILAGAGTMPFDKVGLSIWNFAESKKLIASPYGLILVVGPTGSGKTTTLHSMLGAINEPERKIWTAEDPVEITQQGLRQVQVHPKIGLTFANAMRAFLRADPDVIMVGEMRDQETAAIGIEASLTGHLVFSTLHTNSAPETVIRLIDMGLDPFSFSDALLGILAQRLARRLCKSCRRLKVAGTSERDELSHYYGNEAFEEKYGDDTIKIYHADGCGDCQGKGYKGRMGLHELLVNNDDIRDAIQRKANAAELRELARAAGMKTLLQDGIEKVISGHTDLNQVMAVCMR